MLTNKLLIILLLSVISFGVKAANIQNNFKSAATLSTSCTLSLTDINFGTVSPKVGGQVQWATGTMTTTCSKGVTATAIASPGNVGSTSILRYMNNTSTSDILNYNLFTSQSNTTSALWLQNYSTFSIIGTGNPQSTTYYGAVRTDEFVPPNNYSDNITVQLNF